MVGSLFNCVGLEKRLQSNHPFQAIREAVSDPQ